MGNIKHLCICASETDEWHGYECSITGGACMYLIPNQDHCATKYGEVEHAKKWIKENNKTISKENKWLYNEPNNDFWGNDSLDTKQEAEKEGIKYAKERGYKEIEIGECIPIPLPCYIDTDGIIEELEEQYANEAGGEYDRELYSDVTKEDLKWLEEELSKVIQKFNERAKIEPNWYTVTNIYSVKINEEVE